MNKVAMVTGPLTTSLFLQQSVFTLIFPYCNRQLHSFASSTSFNLISILSMEPGFDPGPTHPESACVTTAPFGLKDD